MANRLIIDGDILYLDGFAEVSDNDTISVNIYGINKVVISRLIPRPNTILDCHNIITINNRGYSDHTLADKLIKAGVVSGTKFLRFRNSYIADIIER